MRKIDHRNTGYVSCYNSDNRQYKEIEETYSSIQNLYFFTSLRAPHCFLNQNQIKIVGLHTWAVPNEGRKIERLCLMTLRKDLSNTKGSNQEAYWSISECFFLYSI